MFSSPPETPFLLFHWLPPPSINNSYVFYHDRCFVCHWISHKWNHIGWTFLIPSFFSPGIMFVFLRFICVVAHTKFVSFYYWIVFYCMNIQQFLPQLSQWWVFVLFPVLASMNKAAINIFVQDFLWACVFISLELNLRMKLLDHKKVHV